MLRNLSVFMLSALLAASPAVAGKGGGKGQGGKGHGQVHKDGGKGHGAKHASAKPRHGKPGKPASVARNANPRRSRALNVRHGVPPVEVDRRVVFVDRDRAAVRSFYTETYGRGGCPPGLAKKDNGCLPPGQAKKRYVVGGALPHDVHITPVPTVLYQRLSPAPSGYAYGVVDGDLLLYSTVGRVVVDVIRSLVD